MKAYYEIDKRTNFPITSEIMSAVEGLEYLGYDTVPFSSDSLSVQNAARSCPYVGSINGMKQVLNHISKLPEPIGFPPSVIDSLGRRIHIEELGNVLDRFSDNKEHIFIKPFHNKIFDGVILKSIEQFSYFKDVPSKTVVYISDPISILSEFRAFVHKNEMVDCRNYSGDFRMIPDFGMIDKIIENYENAPVAYTIDVGVCKKDLDQSTVVIELNDFYAISGFGLDSEIYAQMLVDRYNEIIK